MSAGGVGVPQPASPTRRARQFDVLTLNATSPQSPSRFERDVTAPSEPAELVAEKMLWKEFITALNLSGVKFVDVKDSPEPDRQRLVADLFRNDDATQAMVLRKWRRLEHTTTRYPTLPKPGHDIDEAKEGRVAKPSTGVCIATIGGDLSTYRSVSVGQDVRSSSPRSPASPYYAQSSTSGTVQAQAQTQTADEKQESIPPWMSPAVARAKAAMRVAQTKRKEQVEKRKKLQRPKSARQDKEKKQFALKTVSHVSPAREKRNYLEETGVKKAVKRSTSAPPVPEPIAREEEPPAPREELRITHFPVMDPLHGYVNVVDSDGVTPRYFTRNGEWVAGDGYAREHASPTPQTRSLSPYNYRARGNAPGGVRKGHTVRRGDGPIFPAGSVVRTKGLAKVYPMLDKQVGKVLGPCEGEHVPVHFGEPFNEMMVPARNLVLHPYLRDINVASMRGNVDRVRAGKAQDMSIPVNMLPA